MLAVVTSMSDMNLTRRFILKALASLPVLIIAQRLGAREVELNQNTVDAIRRHWRNFLPGDISVPSPRDKISYTESQWRDRLYKRQFQVLRQSSTEPSFSSPLNSENRPGLFVCAGCDLPLFSSEMKYNSGTGWPSFFTTIPKVFNTKDDSSLFAKRTEYHCVRCGGHHGHVFDDGPPPTGQRWCNNGVALKFVGSK